MTLSIHTALQASFFATGIGIAWWVWPNWSAAVVLIAAGACLGFMVSAIEIGE